MLRYSFYIVNLILFDSKSKSQILARSDLRCRHLLEVLGSSQGKSFRAGVINGPVGIGVINEINSQFVKLSFNWDEEKLSEDDITVVVGFPRPQIARKILFHAATLGCREINFVQTELSDPNYSKSKLWTTIEWKRHLIDGLQQARATMIPKVTWDQTLENFLKYKLPKTSYIVLDNNRLSVRLSKHRIKLPIVMAIGPERGWTDRERKLFQRYSFEFCSIGDRILRVETACIASLSIVKSKLGKM